MPRALAKLALLVGTLGLLAGAGEAVVRSLPTRNDVVERDGKLKYRFNPYRTDAQLGYALRADWETVHATDEFRVTVRTNGLGLRGGPAAQEKPAGTLRLLVVGDSFAFGFGVEDDEAFAARLEALLEARLGRPVEVLNAGVPGWSADQQLIWLRTRGLALDPDGVVLATMENDLGDLAWHRLELDAERLPLRVEPLRHMIDPHGRLRYVESGPRAVRRLQVPGHGWLGEHSALYRWLRSRVSRAWVVVGWRATESRRRREAGPPPAGAIASLAPDEVQRGLFSGSDFRLRYHRHLVDAIEHDCRARDIPLFVLLVVRRESAPKAGSALAGFHEDCARRGALCLDTASLFPPEARSEAYFADDPHWTAAGHATVAEALAGRLVPLLR